MVHYNEWYAFHNLVEREGLVDSWCDTLAGHSVEAGEQRYLEAMVAYHALLKSGVTPYAAAREACGYTRGPQCTQSHAVEGMTQPIPESQVLVPEILKEEPQ